VPRTPRLTSSRFATTSRSRRLPNMNERRAGRAASQSVAGLRITARGHSPLDPSRATGTAESSSRVASVTAQWTGKRRLRPSARRRLPSFRQGSRLCWRRSSELLRAELEHISAGLLAKNLQTPPVDESPFPRNSGPWFRGSSLPRPSESRSLRSQSRRLTFAQFPADELMRSRVSVSVRRVPKSESAVPIRGHLHAPTIDGWSSGRHPAKRSRCRVTNSSTDSARRPVISSTVVVIRS
jgi:hypothetical protein